MELGVVTVVRQFDNFTIIISEAALGTKIRNVHAKASDHAATETATGAALDRRDP